MIFELSHILGGGFKNFYFHPYLGKIPNLTNIFQMGWNHQLVSPQKNPIITPWKINGWNLRIHPIEHGKSSSKLSFSGSMLIFGVYLIQPNNHHFRYLCWLFGSATPLRYGHFWGIHVSMFNFKIQDWNLGGRSKTITQKSWSVKKLTMVMVGHNFWEESGLMMRAKYGDSPPVCFLNMAIAGKSSNQRRGVDPKKRGGFNPRIWYVHI